MMPEDELADLAADIAERGLLAPIMLDAEGRILDGRNREAACKIAKVTPAFEAYEGDDPAGYALAVNIQRRNLTKGQQAMIVAKARLETKQPVRLAAESAGLKANRVAYASTVLEFAPDLADAVTAGAAGLDEAYKIARDRKTAADSAEAQLERLRAEDPDLADKVVQGDLTLAGAWAERREREKAERIDREHGREAAGRILATLKGDAAVIMLAARHGEVGLVTPA